MPCKPAFRNNQIRQLVLVITRTLQDGKKDRVHRIAQLAKKVQELLTITPRDGNQEQFLQTVLRDYQYYALEEI